MLWSSEVVTCCRATRSGMPLTALLKQISRKEVVDSEASFKARCSLVCGDLAIHGKLLAQQVKTFSDLAFACGTPQAPPSEEDFNQFCDKILGSGASVGDAAKLRRLHFESSAYVTASLKAQVMGETSEAPKKLPVAEKTARVANQRQRLKGKRSWSRHTVSLTLWHIKWKLTM